MAALLGHGAGAPIPASRDALLVLTELVQTLEDVARQRARCVACGRAGVLSAELRATRGRRRAGDGQLTTACSFSPCSLAADPGRTFRCSRRELERLARVRVTQASRCQTLQQESAGLDAEAATWRLLDFMCDHRSPHQPTPEAGGPSLEEALQARARNDIANGMYSR